MDDFILKRTEKKKLLIMKRLIPLKDLLFRHMFGLFVATVEEL